MEAHAAGAAALLGDEEKVRAVVEDYATAPISDAEKALFEYIERLTIEPASIREEHVASLRSLGWSDEAIYDAVTVCGLFNFYNRYVDGTGDHDLRDAEGYRATGSRIARFGYSQG